MYINDLSRSELLLCRKNNTISRLCCSIHNLQDCLVCKKYDSCKYILLDRHLCEILDLFKDED